mgnify:CR=1 FL=1
MTYICNQSTTETDSQLSGTANAEARHFMPLKDIFDETLDINSTADYILILQVGYEELTFTILDAVRNKYVFLRSYTPDEKSRYSPDEIAEIIEKDDFLLKKYKKSIILTTSGLFTMVPASLYDPGKKDIYFELNHGKIENHTVLNNMIPEADSCLLYGISTPLYEIIKNHFPSAILYHQLKPLFCYMDKEMRKLSGPYMHINVENESFSISLFSNYSLLYLNSFQYRNCQDIVYYILNIIRSYGAANIQSIHLSGNTDRFDELTSLLSLYLKSVLFAEPSGNFSFSYIFNDTGLHRMLSLFSAVNCES